MRYCTLLMQVPALKVPFAVKVCSVYPLAAVIVPPVGPVQLNFALTVTLAAMVK